MQRRVAVSQAFRRTRKRVSMDVVTREVVKRPIRARTERWGTESSVLCSKTFVGPVLLRPLELSIRGKEKSYVREATQNGNTTETVPKVENIDLAEAIG